MKVLCIFVSLVVAAKADYHEEIGIPLAARIKAFEDEIFDEEPETKFRVAGGEFVDEGAIPYLVGLIIKLENTRTSMCAGSLLSNHHVVTIAQCMVGAKSMIAVLGSIYLYRGGTRISSTEYKIHSSFNQSRSLDYDIAKIKLSEEVKFSDTIKVVYLPSIPYEVEMLHEWAVAAGWGLTTDDEYFLSTNTRVSRVRLKIIPEWYCQDAYNVTQVLFNNVCTSGNGAVGMCQGDAGAPLVVRRSGLDILIGLSSYGPKRCEDGHPDAFTRMASYRNFVKRWAMDE